MEASRFVNRDTEKNRHGTKGSSRERSCRSSRNTSGRYGRDFKSQPELGIWHFFNLAIDSKLRGCHVVSVKADDVAPHRYTVDRATIRKRKTGQPLKFETPEQPRQAIDEPSGDTIGP